MSRTLIVGEVLVQICFCYVIRASVIVLLDSINVVRQNLHNLSYQSR